MDMTEIETPYAELHGRVAGLVGWAREHGYRSTLARVERLLDGLPDPRDAAAERAPGPVERALRDEWEKDGHGSFNADNFKKVATRLSIPDRTQSYLGDLVIALLGELGEPDEPWDELCGAVLDAAKAAGIDTAGRDSTELAKMLGDRLKRLTNAQEKADDARCAAEGLATLAGVEYLGEEDATTVIRRATDAIKPRLMPEGMEWPRGADGLPIVIGEEVYGEDGAAWRVVGIDGPGVKHSVIGRGPGGRRDLRPKWLAHERPAPLDADGVPIRVGDTVWTANGLECFVVKTARLNGRDYVHTDAGAFAASFLTHREPDSWERWEARVAEVVAALLEDVAPEAGRESLREKYATPITDLVRRARALAEGGGGE